MVILVLLVVLGAVVPGCRHVVRYDRRLVVADSLMRTNPDSALSLLESLNSPPAWGEVAPSDGGGGAALATDGDRAYRDLLLTQARYKAYITATSDSDINRALAYFSAHPADREKLTRAYIYKGAVMDELGHPDSAMLYYKTAESTAAPDDYFNLGYCNLRIAELYQNQVSQDSAAITRLKDAIRCFQVSRDTTLIISALGILGSICGDRYPDSAIIYLKQAIELSRQHDPSLQYSPKSTLAGIMLFRKEYMAAKNLALDIILNGSEFCNETQYYYYAAMSYAKLGLIDSARFIMQITPAPVDAVDSLAYYNLEAEIGYLQRNQEQFTHNLVKSKNKAIQILSSSKEGELIHVESAFDQKRQLIKNRRLHVTQLFLIVCGAIFFILAAIFIAYRQKVKNTIIKNEIATVKDDLEKKIALFEQQQELTSGRISELVGLRMSAMQELYKEIRIISADDTKEKRIISLNSMFKSLNEKNLIKNLDLKDSFWEKMKLSVDGEYNGIVTFVKNRFPDLSENDINLFCLLCAGISPQIIRICMNYTSDKTSSSYRNRIIRNKMGLDMTFDEFIENYMRGEIHDLL